MEESLLKDQLQTRLNTIANFNNLILEKKTATGNVDVYIKTENMLSLSLNTNSISFDDFNVVDDFEKTNAVELTVSSSLPYEVNAYLPHEIQNSDKSAILDKNIFKIKASSEPTYNVFDSINSKLQLLDALPAGNDISHTIYMMLKGGLAHKKDVYKATIKFEINQK
ncbi:hypothetical protein [Romboutsia sp. 1001713B170207_170306_H8]|uniref:hypothetical protein n=1 Tax=Romboutsia sp. 1001713B170207_170306_H8 TaxID=2787112 RepID=UPI0018984573|nr:hypothetical protein [Romboutsia sp. 1001713B170207_170306_H8]